MRFEGAMPKLHRESPGGRCVKNGRDRNDPGEHDGSLPVLQPFIETHQLRDQPAHPGDESLEDTDSGDTTNFLHTVAEEDPNAHSLIVIRGHQFGKKLDVPKTGEGLVIGRDESCDVVIGSARDGTSRRHARVFFEGEEMMVEDLGSTNGLLVNRLHCRRNGLGPSDLLQVGKTVFKVVGDGYEGHYHDTMYAKAVRDNLTGLLNRTNLNHVLETEVRRAQRYEHPLSVLLLDLDHFKRVNDTYGHLAGDAVLVQASRLLQSCLRKCDSIYRYGGEEFLVMLPETDVEGAEALAERIRVAVAEAKFEYGCHSLDLTISVGVASLQPKLTGQGLIQRADGALYDAKRGGRDLVVVAHQTGTGRTPGPRQV